MSLYLGGLISEEYLRLRLGLPILRRAYYRNFTVYWFEISPACDRKGVCKM